MGKLYHGITGHQNGKIGNLVFYTLNGRQVSRTIGKINKPPTEGQLRNRMEMKMVVGFLKFITEFINVGFYLKAKGTVKTPYNLAVSYNKLHALIGVYPTVEIDYEKIRVTEGSLTEVIAPAIHLIADGLNFSWLCPDNLEWPRQTDQVMLLVYFPLLNEAVYVLYGEKRLECGTVLVLQADLLNAYMEVYVSFVSNDRKSIANSTYLGHFNKPG